LFGGGGHETYGAQQRMLADPNFDEHKHRDAVNALSPADLYAAKSEAIFRAFQGRQSHIPQSGHVTFSRSGCIDNPLGHDPRGLMRYRLRPFEGRLRNR
jgi:hypothetical protein